MGLLKKIRSKRSMRPIRLRRKKSAAAVVGSEASSDDGAGDRAWQYQVTATPKEYSREPSRGYFDWLTNKMDDLGNAGGSADETDTSKPHNACHPVELHVPPGTYDGWAWLSSCWGPTLVKTDNTTDDDPTFQSSYDSSCASDGTGESSQPSMSRVDQVLKLAAVTSDVSDITSAPSIDIYSESESEELSESGD